MKGQRRIPKNNNKKTDRQNAPNTDDREIAQESNNQTTKYEHQIKTYHKSKERNKQTELAMEKQTDTNEGKKRKQSQKTQQQHAN